ncbi:MAG: glycosyltransferase family 2 protein [Candidatus Goldbacteria bacterium]|nr:glycosyltransferase family 2 protein [Candidatus Goldiibacteriota bacterium]
MPYKPKVYIIILNYLNWMDTIECMESVVNTYYKDKSIIVVNNGADAQSYIKIKDFAGRFPDADIHIINSEKNNGYAAGNNAGIRYAMSKGDAKYLWIINNDTVVMPDSIDMLVEYCEEMSARGRKLGITASKIYYYGTDKIINGVGGRYNKMFGDGKLIGVFQKDKGQYDNCNVKLDYVPGSAMFVSAKFINETGLLNEEYFLFYEEMDWSLRGKKMGFELGYCCKSVVFHKEGATIGSSSSGGKNSELAEFYGLRNRIFFTKKYFPLFLPFVCLGFIGVLINRLMRKQPGRIKNVLKAFGAGILYNGNSRTHK